MRTLPSEKPRIPFKYACQKKGKITVYSGVHGGYPEEKYPGVDFTSISRSGITGCRFYITK